MTDQTLKAIAALVCALLAVAVFAFALGPTRTELDAIPKTVVTVHTYDTWWTISKACNIDRATAVQYLADLNDLDPDEPLPAGRRVTVCAGR